MGQSGNDQFPSLRLFKDSSRILRALEKESVMLRARWLIWINLRHVRMWYPICHRLSKWALIQLNNVYLDNPLGRHYSRYSVRAARLRNIY